MPASEHAAATPAYSAQIVPKFASSRPTTAKYPHRWPQRARIAPTNPLPLAAPMRIAIRWNWTSRIVDAGMIHNSR
jgi:hypothetical protein